MLVDRFFEMEKKYDLFSMKENGIFIWDLFRMHIYLKYHFPETKKKYLKRSFSYKPLLWHFLIPSIKSIPYFMFKNGNIIIIPVSRHLNKDKKLHDKSLMNIISYYESAFIVENHDTNKAYLYDACCDFSRLFRKIYHTVSKKLSVSNYEIIRDALITTLGESKITYNELSAIYSNYWSDYTFYKWFFRIKHTRKVFFVQDGLKKGMILAAHSLKIATYELQHGSFDRSHLSYSYPDNIKQGSKFIIFPENLLTFGSYWGKDFNLPANIISIGNDYFTVNNSQEKSKENGLLFISSKIHGKDLAQLAVNFSIENPNIRIKFKLHSNEIDNIPLYDSLFGKYKNIEIIKSEHDLHQLIEISELVVLIASTVAYEALNFGKKIAIYKRVNFMDIQDLFKLPNVYLLENSSELGQILNLPIAKIDTVFFEKFNEKKMEII